MKKALLLPLILLALTSHSQSCVRASYDPRSPAFALYWNDRLSVESISLSGKTMQEMFAEDSLYVDKLQDDIYFSYRYNYRYKIWLPELKMLFIVRPLPKTRSVPLGDHLVMFIDVLRTFRKSYKM